jgi:hypothetical protein
VHLTRGALLSGLEHHGFVAERRSALRGGQVAIGWLDGLVGSLPGGLRLYPALRAAGARDVPMAPRERALALAAAVLLTPVALAGAALEAALGRSGTVYVEARRG